ncbi:lytic transglycosylase domain-containing protein [Actinomycetospora endophytica]|uniref:Lytic transglycosylase domain-containing protein n=1 Tax=Actinomycetospora endophytica TaxID=2291215 RepID=A0ABS8PA84_9PSEU|nr:lytic transglycosylase domain-containing protein [Actinomycetospora endophytica]MCD2195186.1 lytic transglycosylase domain-containing protein [Actinomycetospora endophytica]
MTDRSASGLRSRDTALRLAVVLGVLSLAGAALFWGTHLLPDGGDTADVPALEVAPAPIVLGTVGQPAAATASVPGTAQLRSWAADLAGRTGIPPRALEAYGLAELVVGRLDPACHLSWVTVAGLARIESDHGRYHGSQVAPDGEVVPPVIGVPLDGTHGNESIAGPDGGSVRARGPLQFIPSTWATWGTDMHGTGRADVDNIDDAAVTAGRYLCADGRDVATGPGWTSAVLSYDASADYARRVFTAASAYASGTSP